MLIAVYVYGRCSTCKKALQFLKNRNVQVKIIEITQTPPSLAQLKHMLEHLGGDIKKLFNTSGLAYRELRLADRLTDMTVDEALTLLTQNGMLVKRPFLIGHDFGLVGFNEKRWSEIFVEK